MQQTVGTMPAAKFRSTKKRVLAARTVMQQVASVKALSASAPVKVEKAKAQKKASIGIASWWPVAVGVFLSGFAQEWLDMANQAGVWAVRIAFPLTLLATHREIGISDQWAPMMPQIALYAQLPLEGLLTKLTMDRGRTLRSAIVQLILVHAVATFVLWLVSLTAQ